MCFQGEQVVKSAQKNVRRCFLDKLIFNGNIFALIYVDVSSNFFCGHQPIFLQRYEIRLIKRPHMLRVASNRGKSQQDGPTYFKLVKIEVNLSSAAPRSQICNKFAFIEHDCLDLPRYCLNFHLGCEGKSKGLCELYGVGHECKRYN